MKWYVYDEATRQCLYVIEGTEGTTEWEATAHYEQNGTPAQLTATGLSGVADAEIIYVG